MTPPGIEPETDTWRARLSTVELVLPHFTEVRHAFHGFSLPPSKQNKSILMVLDALLKIKFCRLHSILEEHFENGMTLHVLTFFSCSK